MDLGTVLSVAQTLFAALQCQELRDVCSLLGYESELQNLARTVSTVKAVLQEAEIMQMQAELPPQAQLYVDQLKDAVYDADDLLDEFVTLAQRKKLIPKGGKISEKVRRLLSRFKPLATTAHRMSRGVKEIRKRLDGIASDHAKYGFKFESKPILRRREESCSYVYAQDVIGREDDIDKIMRKLLDPDVKRDVSCLAIVGMGGLGKTALAQLVYNHPRTEENFSLRLWTCVADQDEKILDVKGVLSKILHSITHENHRDLALETLQKQLRDQLAGKKYLIVLDDVWSENRLRLLDLAKYMTPGLKGSWIVVTTRSLQTARILGDELVHELKGLSEKDSWHLFERTAFGEGHKQLDTRDLVEIGEEIVKRCAGVPLAIKVVGSLLYGHPKEKWVSFQKKGLGLLKYGEGAGIEPILKLSYHHLDSPLKTCFSYCALFPKDLVIEKEQLLNLWMAQDYVVPEEGQSLQDASDEYFSILVRRCFFQDVVKDEYGKIITCKIHDLMHDIAQEVAGKEIYVTNSLKTDLGGKIRHLSYMSIGEGVQWSCTSNKIRTCRHIGYIENCIPVDKLLKNWMCLRALDLNRSGIERLPNALGKLLHLRYLDLSYNSELETLPNSVTKLHNLQTLILRGCDGLRELPESLPKLVNLRVLDIDRIINRMPRGMGKLSCLQKLPRFVVGDNNSTTKQSIVGQMEELKALTQLKGSLQINILKNTEYIVENVGERGYIRNKQHLTRVEIKFPSAWEAEEHNRMRDDEEGLLLEDLQPHPKLRELELSDYMGRRMPSWAREDELAISLPNLVKVSFLDCRALQHLPSLGKFRDLKFLRLYSLDDLEYIENTTRRANISDGAGTSEPDAFFPSLEELWLLSMPKLKGWWRDDEISNCNGEHGRHLLPSFPRLIRLRIRNCPHLTCIPPCPAVEELELLGGINENLGIMDTSESGNSKLRCVRTDNSRCLKTILPIEGFQRLEQMEICLDDEVECLSEVGEVFRSCSSSLKSLKILGCSNLKSLCRALEHLTVLESIEIGDMRNLNLSDKGVGEDEDGKPWELPELVSLPKGIQYLTALQSLYIIDCKRLESLPESMRKLTSLKQLGIRACSAELNERCREPNGEDWPKIQHIPHIAIQDHMTLWDSHLHLISLLCRSYPDTRPICPSEAVMSINDILDDLPY